MKRLLAIALVIVLLPVGSWGQRRATAPRPAPPKPETMQARYARLDLYARQLPESQITTIEKLAASLAAQARSDDDKARLIFAWLAYHIAYDVSILRGDTTKLRYRCTPAAVLQNRKAICQGYANLFTDLATRLKLEAYTVDGHARNLSTVGNMLDDANGHAWNAYRIAGALHLADATWGAGGTLPESQQFKWEFNPFWFDTPPSQLIFTHLPSDATWQLLPAPVTPAAFQGWPYVAPSWFQLVAGPSLLRALGASKGSLGYLPAVEDKATKSAPPVQIVQVPLQGDLVAGRAVKFVFLASAEVEITIEQDTVAVVLQPIGRHQQATITPRAGYVNVVAWHKADTTAMYSIQYQVVLAPAGRRLRPGEHRAAPADSVVYLRR